MIKIFKYGETDSKEIFKRNNALSDVSHEVKDILNNVREKGDSALREYALKFDKCKLADIKVSDKEINEALTKVEDRFKEVIKRSAANIRSFHEKQVRNNFLTLENEGVIVGQKIIPIENVGVYVPNGSAPLSSTVLMDVIPAKIAGCKRIVMVAAPDKDGTINPYIIAAAVEAGVDEIYKAGGAQAIGALAYGTESVPKVDKIVGPGSAYVAEAKREVTGLVAIDMIAGPSEILAVADSSMDEDIIAADLLSQAEHDKNATAVLVTDSMDYALKVQAKIEERLRDLPREEIARASIENNGKIIVADNLLKAIDIANELAPEHLELAVDEPFKYLPLIKHAGSIFLGKNAPEALGDYFAGPNHTLPTGGTARFYSPLSVDDFVKKSQFIYYSGEAIDKVSDDIAYFAEKESLMGHAKSVKIRSDKRRENE